MADITQPFDFYQMQPGGGGFNPLSFSGLLFGGADSGLNDYLNEDQRNAIQRQAMLQAAGALLQAGGPSTQRISLGQALGGALQAGAKGYGEAQQNAIAQLLTKQKLDEAKLAQDQRQRLEKIFGTSAPVPGVPITPEQAIAAPVTAELPAGPTAARAAMIGQTPEATAISPEDVQYNKYMQAAQLFAASAPEKSKAYQELAKAIKPTPEVVGEPYRTAEGKTFQRTKTGGRIEIPTAEAPAVEPIGGFKEATDANGQPVLVQQYKDGTFKTVEGFGVPRELVQVNLGGKITFVDKNKIPANATYLVGMSPGEEARLKIEQQNLGIALKRLNLSQAEFQRGNYDRVETPDGFVYVSKVPGLPVIPVMGPGGEQLGGKSGGTEDQAKAAGFALRMNQATQLFNKPIVDPNTNQPVLDVNGKPLTLENAFGVPSRTQAILRNIPSAGITTGLANFFETEGRQQYRQAQENWITANLRAESGAAIGVDEMEKEIQKYFPQANDKQSTISQKAQARKAAELAMQVRGGPAFKNVQKAAATPTPAPKKTGRLVFDQATGMTRYVED